MMVINKVAVIAIKRILGLSGKCGALGYSVKAQAFFA
jgi:hypothetical protein